MRRGSQQKALRIRYERSEIRKRPDPQEYEGRKYGPFVEFEEEVQEPSLFHYRRIQIDQQHAEGYRQKQQRLVLSGYCKIQQTEGNGYHYHVADRQTEKAGLVSQIEQGITHHPASRCYST